MRAQFVFDQTKCTGCQACVLACTIENQLTFGHSWRTVYTFNDRHYPGIPVRHLSLACNHCEDPACLRACPANAYSKDEVTGIVALDERSCIGCRYCTWACPYGAPRFDAADQVIRKCNFCMERRSAGKKPACVELCPTGALGFTEKSDQTSERITLGFPQTHLGPAISFPQRTHGRPIPESSAQSPRRPYVPVHKGKSMPVAVREEWPLAGFTFIVPVLVALMTAAALGGYRPSAITYGVLAALAAVLSLGHLGKKSRAWRAVMNPLTSWLSREVSLFIALAMSGTALIGLQPTGWVWSGITVAVGFATLLAIDLVYLSLPHVTRGAFHSAGAALSACFFIAIFLSLPLTAVLLGAFKLVLYLTRKRGFRRDGKSVRPALSILRVASGFVLPVLLWILLRENATYYVVGAVLLGELIDRMEFYAELDVVSPARQMTLDLQVTISARQPVSAS